MNWHIYITNHAEKQIKKYPISDTIHITHSINEMEHDPFTGDIEKLKGGENIWRRRIGNYRIIYEIFRVKKFIAIYEVTRRTSKNY